MSQAIKFLLIVCLVRGALTNLSTKKLFVTSHDAKFLKVKDWLHYLDADEDYTYAQANETCFRLKLMSPVHFLLSIRKTLPSKGEFWIPALNPMMASNGIHKLVNGREDLTNKKGIICQAPLDGALVVYRNGTLFHLDASTALVPSYCYPQAELSEQDLNKLELSMCLLLRNSVM